MKGRICKREAPLGRQLAASCLALVCWLPSASAVDNPWFDLHSGQPVGDGSSEPPGPPGGTPPPDCDSCPCEGAEGQAGDPVYTADGKFFLQFSDLHIPGPLPLEVRRTYHTQYLYNGPLGYGWDFAHNERLYRLGNTNLVLRRGHVDTDEFTPDAGSIFAGPPGSGESITEHPDGTYTLRRPDGMEHTYAADGTLARVEDLEGNQLQFSYDPAGKLPIQGLSEFSASTNPVVIARDFRLTRIDEATGGGLTGRRLEFGYHADGRITNVTAHTGSDVPDLAVNYGYDAAGNLTRYVDVEGLEFPYAYDDAHRMTNFYSSGCTCLARGNAFDEEDRVLQQTIGHTVIDFEYLIPGSRTRVTTHIFDEETLTLLRRRVQIFDFDGAGRVVQHLRQMGLEQDPGGGEDDDLITQFVYDPITEEIVQKTDPDGVVVTFTYDAADRLLTRSRSSAGQSLTAHWAYDGVGRVTNQYTSWSGNPGVRYDERAWTYDPQGRMLTKARIGTNGTQLVTSYSYTTNGASEVVTRTDPEGNRMRYEYNASDFLVWEYDPDNPSYQTLHGYDSRGNRTNQVDALGREIRWEYDAKGRLVREINALGYETLHTYQDGNLIREEWGRDGATPGRIKVHEYDDHNRRIATYRLDEGGQSNLWQRTGYDSIGTVVYRQDAMGRRETYTYDPADRLIVTEDIHGVATTNRYDQGNRLVSVVDGLGVETEVAYNVTLGVLTSRVEAVGTPVERDTQFDVEPGPRTRRIRYANGMTMEFAYDEFGRLASTAGARRYPRQYGYDGNDRLTVITDGNGYSTTNRYDAYGRRIEIRYPDAATEEVQFNNVGHALARSDGNFNTTYLTYDALDRLVGQSVVNDSNHVLRTWVYNPWGEWVTRSNALGGTASRTYDRLGRLTTEADRRGLELQHTYDPMDRRISVIWPNGSFTSNVFDGVRVAYLRNRAGHSISNSFDALGRPIQRTRSSGLIQTYTYDPLGRMVLHSNSLGQVTTMAYDIFDQATNLVHPDGLVESIAYDAYGNVTNRTGGGRHTVGMAYDSAGNQTNLVDALGNATHWTYDSRNRARRKTYADGQFFEFGYDAAHNLTARTDALGRTTYLRYTNEHQLVSIDYPDDPDVFITYDVLNRPLLARTGSTTNEWVYDAAGNLVTQVQHHAATTLSYTYDSEGNRASMTVRGLPTQYEYDAAGRLVSLSNQVGRIEYVWRTDADWIDTVMYPSGATVSNQYDSLGRLVSAQNLDSTGGVVSSYAYQYNQANLITNVVLADGSSRAFFYDSLRQLASASGSLSGGAADPSYQFDYGYDAMGNYTQVTRNAETTVYAVNTLNQYTSSQAAPAAPVAYAYDANGNLTADGVQQYGWDDANRLRAVTNGNRRVEIEYNAHGRRTVTRSYENDILQTTRKWIYDHRLPLAEVDESNDLVRAYTTGLDRARHLNGHFGGIGGYLALTEFDGAVTEDAFFFYDGMGNVTELVSPADAIQASYRYGPFGTMLSSTGSAAADNPFRFHSKPLLSGTPLADFGFRYYQPALGRWLSRDPLGEAVGAGLYVFANNDPVQTWDAFGLAPQREEFTLLGPTKPTHGFSEEDLVYVGRFEWDCSQPWTSTVNPYWYAPVTFQPNPINGGLRPNEPTLNEFGTFSEDRIGPPDNVPEFVYHFYTKTEEVAWASCVPPGCDRGTGNRAYIRLKVHLYGCSCRNTGEPSAVPGRSLARCQCRRVDSKQKQVDCPCRTGPRPVPPPPSPSIHSDLN